MSDMENGSNQSNIDVSEPVSQPISQSNVSSSNTEERVFRQSELNNIIGREKHEAVERYKRQLTNSSSPKTEQTYSDNKNEVYVQPNISKMVEEATQSAMNKQFEELRKSQEKAQADEFAKTFFNKLSTGKEMYDDFDNVMGDMDFSRIPYTAQIASGFDNLSGIMYDLRKNPTKMVEIEQLYYINPKYAYEAIANLSRSIKENEKASSIKNPNEPLSRLRPSNHGMESSQPSFSELRRKYRG